MANDQLFVKSHVARDLLQSASLFKTDRLVVWEYVSNGLQYTEPGINTEVRVLLDSKAHKISILDNGRGMDWEALRNFFIMHGENQDRREGRPGRGRFGTGKSAAFGIADTLRVTTIRNKKRSIVELKRKSIESMTAEDPIPVAVVERDAPTSQLNGTLVQIEGVHLRSLDQAGIIRYIERHLAHWSKNVTVFVNNHECEVSEPPISRTLSFKPTPELARQLGDVDLVVKVAKAPLDEDLRGVSIFSNGVWYETTLAGLEGREMSQYIFGEFEVPALDEYSGPIAPFDMSRSMQLNPHNPVVLAIYTFLGQSIEQVRRELAEADKQRRADEDAKRLQNEADAIAQIINEDFRDFRQKLARVRARASGTTDNIETDVLHATLEGSLLFKGGTELGNRISDEGAPGATGGKGGRGGEPRDLFPVLERAEEGSETGRPVEHEESQQRTTRGGFQVKFDNLGEAEFRGKYVRDERTIYINLDHPQIAAARGNVATSDPSFMRLAYEVAFAEYAIALSSELASSDEYLEPSDAIIDIREAINRLAVRGAHLYEAN